MPNQRITLILSDLHVGGGMTDPGDDHIYDRNQLVEFLRTCAISPEGQAGRYELFFNGDFLEFAQTDVSAFTLVDEDAWCTEAESLHKLDTIIAGHPEIFAALSDFQASGNLVTIAAGNHDVDLYWPAVQQRLRQHAGTALGFELGKEWVERYDGKLHIGHGHMRDVANRFKNWAKPMAAPRFPPRLEMCPGTLFMVKFVNHLEAKFPFADNLLPVTKLVEVLGRDDKSGFMAVSWAFTRFIATTSVSVLGIGDKDYGERLLAKFRQEPAQFEALQRALETHGKTRIGGEEGAAGVTPDALAEHMFFLLGRLDDAAWGRLFELGHGGAVLGGSGVTLSAIGQANLIDGKETLREAARRRVQDFGAHVVVMGHTHQPDELEIDDSKYYNPGSWTRYWQLERTPKLTLADLKDESNYPYELNVVRVEQVDGVLKSSMNNIERWEPHKA